jgi:hypothetical protein
MSDILKVSATDLDYGSNSRLRYHVADSNALQDFGINPLSGEIFVRRPLDRERQAEYRFLVIATDQGSVSRCFLTFNRQRFSLRCRQMPPS